MKYVIDIPDESCHNCQLSYMNNDSGDFANCTLLGHTVFNAKHQGICPLIPVEEIDIENTDGSHTRGYKEIHTSVKTLEEYKEKQMQDPEFREEYEKVIDKLRKEIQ